MLRYFWTIIFIGRGWPQVEVYSGTLLHSSMRNTRSFGTLQYFVSVHYRHTDSTPSCWRTWTRWHRDSSSTSPDPSLPSPNTLPVRHRDTSSSTPLWRGSISLQRAFYWNNNPPGVKLLSPMYSSSSGRPRVTSCRRRTGIYTLQRLRRYFCGTVEWVSEGLEMLKDSDWLMVLAKPTGIKDVSIQNSLQGVLRWLVEQDKGSILWFSSWRISSDMKLLLKTDNLKR